MPNELATKIFAIIASVAEVDDTTITAETSLIGDASLIDSMKLVEICLALEDLSVENGFDFDWTSESAMSKSRSMFRTAGSLVAEFLEQQAGAAK